jgi:hypothetical protein
MEAFKSGSRPTTQLGYVNRNQQECLGTRGVAGSDHLQVAYKMECLICGHFYGANGTDIFQRKCPACQDGALGPDF